jgi:hypothetical protein
MEYSDVSRIQPVPARPAAADDQFRVVVLDDLAKEIRFGHAAVLESMSNALDMALHTGDALLEARSLSSPIW